jgi:TldD protein
MIFNSEGLRAEDRRITGRLRLQATVEVGDRSKYEWRDFTRPQGFEAFRTKNDFTSFAREFVIDMAEDLKAAPLKVLRSPGGFRGRFVRHILARDLRSSARSLRSFKKR